MTTTPTDAKLAAAHRELAQLREASRPRKSSEEPANRYENVLLPHLMPVAVGTQLREAIFSTDRKLQNALAAIEPWLNTTPESRT